MYKSIWPLAASILVTALGSACQAEQPNPEQTLQPLTTATHQTVRLVLPWGGEPHQLGLDPGGPQQPPKGPATVAIAPDGRLAVLDTVKQRIALFKPDGAYAGSIPADRLDTDIAILPDGTTAVLNLAATTVRTLAQDGQLLDSTLAGPSFKTATGIDYVQGRLWLVTAYQEAYPVGPQMLRQKREGLPSHGVGFFQVVPSSEQQGRYSVLKANTELLKGDGQSLSDAGSFESECTGLFPLLFLADGRRAWVCDQLSTGKSEPEVRRAVVVASPSGAQTSLAVAPNRLYAMFRPFRTTAEAVLAAVPLQDGLHVTIWYPHREVTP